MHRKQGAPKITFEFTTMTVFFSALDCLKREMNFSSEQIGNLRWLLVGENRDHHHHMLYYARRRINVEWLLLFLFSLLSRNVWIVSWHPTSDSNPSWLLYLAFIISLNSNTIINISSLFAQQIKRLLPIHITPLAWFITVVRYFL